VGKKKGDRFWLGVWGPEWLLWEAKKKKVGQNTGKKGKDQSFEIVHEKKKKKRAMGRGAGTGSLFYSVQKSRSESTGKKPREKNRPIVSRKEGRNYLRGGGGR